jgi:acetolactate synthase I/II/III large subunit
VFTTATARGVLDEQSANSLGVYTGDGKQLAAEFHAFADCDLVVGLGLRNLEVLSTKGFGRPLILIDETDPQLTDGFGADVFWQTARGEDYQDVLSSLAARPWGRDLVEFSRARITAGLADDAWLPRSCFECLNELQFEYNAVVDTGSFCTIAEHCWYASPSRRFFGSSIGRFMGGSIPTAIGVATADAPKPVICIAGDGGIRMYIADFRIAAKEKLPLCLILMSDGRYGSVACTDSSGKMSRSAISVAGVSWSAAVEGMGCLVANVQSEDAFARAMAAWNRAEPLFVECQFPVEAYASMIRNLR